MSNTTICGNITRTELKYTPSGQAVLTFGVAENRRWKDKQGEQQEATSFFDCVAWGSLAENGAESLEKGARVIVSGRLEQRSWESPEGEKRNKVEIVVDSMGPDLRFATAQVQKNERRGGDANSVAASFGGAVVDNGEPF